MSYGVYGFRYGINVVEGIIATKIQTYKKLDLDKLNNILINLHGCSFTDKILEKKRLSEIKKIEQVIQIKSLLAKDNNNNKLIQVTLVNNTQENQNLKTSLDHPAQPVINPLKEERKDDNENLRNEKSSELAKDNNNNNNNSIQVTLVNNIKNGNLKTSLGHPAQPIINPQDDNESQIDSESSESSEEIYKDEDKNVGIDKNNLPQESSWYERHESSIKKVILLAGGIFVLGVAYYKKKEIAEFANESLENFKKYWLNQTAASNVSCVASPTNTTPSAPIVSPTSPDISAIIQPLPAFLNKWKDTKSERLKKMLTPENIESLTQLKDFGINIYRKAFGKDLSLDKMKEKSKIPEKVWKLLKDNGFEKFINQGLRNYSFDWAKKNYQEMGLENDEDLWTFIHYIFIEKKK